ncbi:multicomponent Na+:H+ antiporter subunit C [Natranaerovirga pectinivora]|uniref:Multicomponent Na+:H+ antiporter subunit C n=1 Tax=Natranaerovirga pectinivora TaxID=682400 RepID=A0A4R3MMH3_9FIRM|nr:cation:proton antiporter subunit C [Natranaerovirga pectinivora]TCT15455.1 multicomponent Na+:H+ antiporter subunit C [Natranaerovirga pectinivora]
MVQIDWINGTNASILIFFIGLYGLITRRNIVKSIISVTIMQTGIILFFIASNHQDPLSEALMITAIVIGAAVTALSLVIFIHLYRLYGTTNWHKLLKKFRGENQ